MSTENEKKAVPPMSLTDIIRRVERVQTDAINSGTTERNQLLMRRSMVILRRAALDDEDRELNGDTSPDLEPVP